KYRNCFTFCIIHLSDSATEIFLTILCILLEGVVPGLFLIVSTIFILRPILAIVVIIPTCEIKGITTLGAISLSFFLNSTSFDILDKLLYSSLYSLITCIFTFLYTKYSLLTL